MTRTKHVFDQNCDCLSYMALGDTAVRCIGIRHLIAEYDLDAVVIYQRNPTMEILWRDVFGNLLKDSIPESHLMAHVSRPTVKDWHYGTAAYNVFESICWENGFFDTSKMKVRIPVIYPCSIRSKRAMIYPKEHTDANKIYTVEWWKKTVEMLRGRGLGINCLGDTMGIKVDAQFNPNISGLKECISKSCLAVGSSTGPTWACLLSDIPQIVLQSFRLSHGYWDFDRCQRVLEKRLEICKDITAAIPSMT